MRILIKPHRFSETVRVPASKSHTIRRLLLAALGEGVSEIRYPLDSLDARSCVAVCRGLGADITELRAEDPLCPNPADEEGKRLVAWTVRGVGGAGLRANGGPLDVGNSGTTLFLVLAAAALGREDVVFTGDAQIARRGAGPLLEALRGLGITVSSGPGGCVPITVRGPWRGGRVSLPCPTSQYLSALLLAAPLAPAGTVTEIDVPLLNEKPYIDLTLSYLKAQGIPWEGAADYSYFRIPGGASYKPVNGPVIGDFSSAAFPGCAAAIGGFAIGGSAILGESTALGESTTLLGLDPHDCQGDKAVFDMLAHMGCDVAWDRLDGEWRLRVSCGGGLRGGRFDLNDTPDLLPVAAVLGAYAEGETALVNVAHARIKETDRIAVMAGELGKLGAAITERPDGLVIRGGGLRGGAVDGHGDHRVVMALAVAALGASGPVEIAGAESAAVTYPGFPELMAAHIIEE
ncbi:MAG: 3-phosphoshikimate 1-carboxyvinyltransferase [Treponema sp.]|jgi:3-phosphoshikimate 1-carboxyvinyltransferase|nr:3-phosphoshikimate 1-carboxyvinyltransferase [Treponema sp.]